MALSDYLDFTRLSHSNVLKDGPSKLFDVKLRSCEGEEVSCHKVFLASASPVFRAMFEGDMVESKDESVVDIKDADIETIR